MTQKGCKFVCVIICLFSKSLIFIYDDGLNINTPFIDPILDDQDKENVATNLKWPISIQRVFLNIFVIDERFFD